MAMRLGEYLYWGEIRHEGEFTTTGNLYLWTGDQNKLLPIRLHLVGDCNPDMNGKRLRFYPPEGRGTLEPVPLDLAKQIAYQQIGTTGTMTAQGWVRELPCSPEEYYVRSKLGEPPSTRWVRHLYLEWYSQNGRVVVETAGYVVERCEREAEEAGEPNIWVSEENLAFPHHALDSSPHAPPQILAITLNDEDEVHCEMLEGLDEKDEDGYGEEYDEEAAAADMRDLETLDRCIERGTGTPIQSLLPDLKNLPRPELLDEEGVKQALKLAAMQLALFNVTFDMCPHATPRSCYEKLVEAIPTLDVFKELRGSGTIHHLCLFEDCELCEVEILADYEKWTKERDEP
jgi:hypothetical protein